MRLLALATVLVILLGINFTQAKQVPCINFFYGPGCPHCAKADSYIRNLEKKYSLKVYRMNANEKIDLLNSFYESYNVPNNERGFVPILFIGNDYLLSDKSIIENLESKIKECAKKGCSCPTLFKGSKEKISLPFILSLAFIDSINPCELAILIILMTAILTKFPKEKIKVIKTGFSFSSAIFIMYFIFGLLIISGFKFLTEITKFNRLWFYKFLGAFAIILGILNIKDAIWYGGGGFLMEVPMSWRPKIKKNNQRRKLCKRSIHSWIDSQFFLNSLHIWSLFCGRWYSFSD